MEDRVPFSEDSQLLAICEAISVGQATDRQIAELEQRMRDEPAVAKTYLDYVALHADLFQITSAQHGRHIVTEQLRTHRSYRIRSARPRPRMWPWIGALAAILLLGMTAVPWNSSDEKRANLSSREVLPAIDGMAVITDIEDVEWSRGAYVFRRGQLLKSSNWLAIEAGHLEIEFGQGAVVVLEGPARFAARSTSVGELQFGKLAAVVPPWAEGFRVDTSSLSVVDRGTKFELEVTRDHQVEVAVTKGEVDLLRSGTVLPSEQLATRLSEGQAMRANGGRLEAITAEPSLRLLGDKLPLRPDHTQAEVVAKFRRDFVDGTSNQPRSCGRWRYFTNSWGPVGGTEGYSELLWDSKRRVYDPNGDQGFLAGSELYAANLSYRGGHPGAGRDQTKANLDHYVIAAYDVPMDGVFRIESGWLVRRESREDIANQSVDLIIHINEQAPIFSETCNRDGLLKFCCPLGTVRKGDRVFVAVGPQGVDFNDRFEWDFAIVRELDLRQSTPTNEIENRLVTETSDLTLLRPVNLQH